MGGIDASAKIPPLSSPNLKPPLLMGAARGLSLCLKCSLRSVVFDYTNGQLSLRSDPRFCRGLMKKKAKAPAKPVALTRDEKATLGRILKKARAYKAFYASSSPAKSSS